MALASISSCQCFGPTVAWIAIELNIGYDSWYMGSTSVCGSFGGRPVSGVRSMT